MNPYERGPYVSHLSLRIKEVTEDSQDTEEDLDMEDNLATEEDLVMGGNLVMVKEDITILTLSKDIITEDTITTVSTGMSMGSPATQRAILAETAWPVWEWFAVLAVALTVLPDTSV